MLWLSLYQNESPFGGPGDWPIWVNPANIAYLLLIPITVVMVRRMRLGLFWGLVVGVLLYVGLTMGAAFALVTYGPRFGLY